MKLICLNVWGGRQGNILLDYIAEQSATTDIFCFQEVFDSKSGIKEYKGWRIGLFSELSSRLPGFNGYFASGYAGWADMEKVDFEVRSGQAIFVRKDIKSTGHGFDYIYGSSGTEISADFTNEPKIIQYCKVHTGSKFFLLANVHGMWHPGSKSDTEDRLEQSKSIKRFLNKHNGPKILCGDFNLFPNTQSVAIFEDDMVNLIKKYGIQNTRNEISWQQYHNKQSFADYVFTSPEVVIKVFSVPYNEVSDHLPMVLEFSV